MKLTDWRSPATASSLYRRQEPEMLSRHSTDTVQAKCTGKKCFSFHAHENCLRQQLKFTLQRSPSICEGHCQCRHEYRATLELPIYSDMLRHCWAVLCRPHSQVHNAGSITAAVYILFLVHSCGCMGPPAPQHTPLYSVQSMRKGRQAGTYRHACKCEYPASDGDHDERASDHLTSARFLI